MFWVTFTNMHLHEPLCPTN